MKIITTQRIVLDKDEMRIRKGWGTDWTRMQKDQKKNGGFGILVGSWSGYSGSRRDVHTEYVPYSHISDMRLHTIRYTDGTTLDIMVHRVTIETLLQRKIERRAGYDRLIREARESAQEVYTITPVKKCDESQSTTCQQV